MHTDELRREVAAMADQVGGFAGDVQILHRNHRRKRVIAWAIAVAAVVALTASGVLVAGSRHDRTVRVSSAPSKEVAPERMTHIDAVVVPATEAVKVALDQSNLVAQYAFVPREALPSSMLDTVQQRAASCALRSSDGYAVTATTAGVHLGADLSKAIGSNAKVYSLADEFGSWDAEIFMEVLASPDEVAALQARLERDPAVRSFHHISADDAYSIFKKEFSDQPALVLGTKPADLPQSFRVILEPGRSVANFADLYHGVAGVDTVITQESRLLWHTPPGAPTAAPTACAKP